MHPQPSIDSNILAVAPDFRAVSIVVEAGDLIDRSVADTAIEQACAMVKCAEPAWAEAHLEAWAEVYKRFGVKPKRASCSADALRKRLLKDGTLPRLDPLVDLYNAISVKYAVPVGGENLAAYAGQPRLTIATGSESFDTMKDGRPIVETPEMGEVIWRDEIGVTCRRWNWRQCVRTRLDSTAHHMWFILESLAPMPIEALHQAGDELISGIETMMSDVKVEKRVLSLSQLVSNDVHAAVLQREQTGSPP